MIGQEFNSEETGDSQLINHVSCCGHLISYDFLWWAILPLLLRLFNVAFEFLHLPHLHYSAVTAVLEDLFFFRIKMSHANGMTPSLCFLQPILTCCNFYDHRTHGIKLNQQRSSSPINKLSERELELQIFLPTVSKKNTSHLNSQTGTQEGKIPPKKKRSHLQIIQPSLDLPDADRSIAAWVQSYPQS